jgi:hypothetical protein
MTRIESFLTYQPPAQVETTPELYAIAFEQAKTAARRYGEVASRGDESFDCVRPVFELLEHREIHHALTISAACVAALDRYPDPADIKVTPADLVPIEELSEFANSSLSTPYGAWALAVRHRERGFAFWTYVAALAKDDAVRAAAEDMAREALHDAYELRRERRLAWHSARHLTTEPTSPEGSGEVMPAAQLERLLSSDILAWSQHLPAVARNHLLAVTGIDATSPIASGIPASGTLEEIKRRAIRRAEQLTSIHLDDADHAVDDARLQLAQQLAARAITRLADLRRIAAT